MNFYVAQHEFIMGEMEESSVGESFSIWSRLLHFIGAIFQSSSDSTRSYSVAESKIDLHSRLWTAMGSLGSGWAEVKMLLMMSFVAPHGDSSIYPRSSLNGLDVA